jgi:hypothetical protein
VQSILLARLLVERIRSGELARFDAELEQAWRLATEVLHSPELQGQLRMVEACRYLAAGDVARAAGIIEPARQAMLNLGTTWLEPGQFILHSSQLLVSGTLADHAEEIAARLAQPDHRSIMPIGAQEGATPPDCRPTGITGSPGGRQAAQWTLITPYAEESQCSTVEPPLPPFAWPRRCS